MSNIKIINVTPNVRVSSYMTGRAGEFTPNIEGGTPIGLLLSLTYTESFKVTLVPYSDFRPLVRSSNIIPNIKILNLNP